MYLLYHLFFISIVLYLFIYSSLFIPYFVTYHSSYALFFKHFFSRLFFSFILFISTLIPPCFVIFYSVLYLAQYSDYTTDRSIGESGFDFYFRHKYLSPPKLPDWHAGPPSLLSTQWVLTFLFPAVKRPGRDANHSPRSSTLVKNEWIFPSTPHIPSWSTQGQLYFSPIRQNRPLLFQPTFLLIHSSSLSAISVPLSESSS